MRITLVAVGRARGGPEAALTARYLERLPWPARIVEVAERGGRGGIVPAIAEAERILKALPPRATVVALDERGEPCSSEGFAERVMHWRDSGTTDLVFAIGGADGLAPAVKQRAAFRLSLGAMTWPHLLARALLAEQLYRASSILAGHPYHRGGTP